MLLCEFFGLTNQVCNYFEFLCKTYFVFENFKGECLKILNLGKLGLKLVFWKAFHLILMYFFFLLFNAIRSVFKKSGYLSKNFVFLEF